MNKQIDVLIIGAGPTGLTAAIEAVRHGLTVHIIDQNACRSIHSKALVAHAKTLEIFHDMGLVDDVLAQGKIFKALNIYDQNEHMARIIFEDLNWKDALYPFWLSIPQSETERCLEERLNQLGVVVERQTKLLHFVQNETSVTATIQRVDHPSEEVTASWLIGCDGSRSRTRKQLNLDFVGQADDKVFVLADVHLETSLPEDEGYNILSPDGVMLIVPLPEPQQRRLIFHMPELTVADIPPITLAYLQSLVAGRAKLNIRVREVGWTSSFTVKHFVASQHHHGRVFLAGDAAHIHSPVGGQGMNSGIQDAYNLIWKLALVQRGMAKPLVLDSYEHERHQVAKRLIKQVNTATKIVTLHNPVGQMVRNRIGHILINTEWVQNQLGRHVAMLDIHYRDSPLSSEPSGRKTAVQAGDRAPNVLNKIAAVADIYNCFYGTHHTILFFTGENEPVSLEQWQALSTQLKERYQAEIRPFLITQHLHGELITDTNDQVIHDPHGQIHQTYDVNEPTIFVIRPDLHIGYRNPHTDLADLTTYLNRLLIKTAPYQR